MKLLRHAALGLSVLLAACAATPPAPEAADFDRWVQQRYAAPFKAGDAATWTQVFAPQAIGLHDRMPALVGQAAIAEFGQRVAGFLRIERFDVVVEELRVNGSWAYTRGSFSTRLLKRSDGSDSGLGGEGKFFFLWERQADGDWKIIVDMGNRKS